MRTLLSTLMLLTACSVEDSPTAVFDATWEDFDMLYGGFSHRDVDWDAARDEYAPRVHDQMSDDALFEVLAEMLTPLDDGHVRLVAPNRTVFESNAVYRERQIDGTFEIDVVETYLDAAEVGPWDSYVRGEVAPGVPYVWFPWIDDNTYVIEDIADAYPDAQHVVIDLRHSRGGSFTYPLVALSRMTAQDTEIFRSRSRNGPDRDAFDAWRTWELEASDQPWTPHVVLLTDAITISASERMILMLQALGQTTTIGSRSNGAHATSIMRELPNGWGLQLPVQEVESFDGNVYEAVGCTVDIEVHNGPDVAETGQDEVLEEAILWIERARD